MAAEPGEGDVEEANDTVDVVTVAGTEGVDETTLENMGLLSFVEHMKAGTGAGSSSGAPPPPPPAAPPVYNRFEDPAFRLPRHKNAIKWGPFSISKVVKDNVHIAYGGNCNMHRNHSDKQHLQCKCWCQGTSDESLRRVMKWLIAGHAIEADDPDSTPMPRNDHVPLDLR